MIASQQRTTSSFPFPSVFVGVSAPSSPPTASPIGDGAAAAVWEADAGNPPGPGAARRRPAQALGRRVEMMPSASCDTRAQRSEERRQPPPQRGAPRRAAGGAGGVEVLEHGRSDSLRRPTRRSPPQRRAAATRRARPASRAGCRRRPPPHRPRRRVTPRRRARRQASSARRAPPPPPPRTTVQRRPRSAGRRGGGRRRRRPTRGRAPTGGAGAPSRRGRRGRRASRRPERAGREGAEQLVRRGTDRVKVGHQQPQQPRRHRPPRRSYVSGYASDARVLVRGVDGGGSVGGLPHLEEARVELEGEHRPLVRRAGVSEPTRSDAYQSSHGGTRWRTRASPPPPPSTLAAPPTAWRRRRRAVGARAGGLPSGTTRRGAG